VESRRAGGGWYSKAFDGTGGGGPIELDYAALPASLSREARLSRLTAWVLAAERVARRSRCACPVPRLRRTGP